MLKLYYVIFSIIVLLISHATKAFAVLDVLIIVNSFLLCKRYRNFNILLIVSFVMGWSNYSCVMMSSDMLGRQLSTYGQYNGTAIGLLGIEILYLHTVLMLALTPSIKTYDKSFKGKSYFEGFNSFSKNSISVICFIVLVIAILFVNIGFALLQYGGYEIVSKSLFEYCIMLYILGLNISRGNKTRWNIMLGLMVVGLVIDFSVRDRIVPLEMIILMYVAHFQYRFSKKQLIPVFIVLLIVMVFLGENREGQAMNSDSISASIDYIKSNLFTLDTAWAAYYCSLTEIDFGQTLSNNEILPFIKSYLTYIFLGTSFQDIKANIATYVLEQGYIHTGGNVSPLFFYFYLKWLGVVLFSLLISFYYHLTLKGKTAFVKCLSLFFLTVSFRWYLYGPASILRGVLIFSLLYVILFKLILSNKKEKKNVDINNYKKITI